MNCGDRVAIFANNRLEWLLADWANICIGALTVPVYAASTATQARHIIEHADPVLLFIDSSKRLGGLQLRARASDQLRSVIVIEGERNSSGVGIEMPVLTLDRLREIGRAYAEQHEGIFERRVQGLTPEDDLTIIYTSGTTGTPKGVLTTHAHYLYMISAVNAAVPSTDADATLHVLPTAHSLGRLEHFMAVAKGWTLAIGRSIETIPRDLRTVRPTVIFCVPRIYENAYHRIRLRMERAGAWRRKIFNWGLVLGKRRIQDRKERKQLSWGAAVAFGCVDHLILSRVRAAFGGRLRLAISGGAPLAQDVGEFFHALGILILEGYGLTETSTVSHVNRPGNYKFGTVGLPLNGTECRVGTDGEILLRGPNIFKCYYRDAIATEEAMDADGWFHTGDVGDIDEEGFLHITDRKKDLLVTSGGKKVAPQKIENLLKTDPVITQVMVVGSGRSHLLALITLDQKRVKDLAEREGITLSSSDEIGSHPWVRALIKERIREKNKQLAPYETVRQFSILTHDFTVEDEELTPTLKLKRQVIMDRYKELIEKMYRRAVT
ncbi:MAG TPA: long-chain fatty acid--CoA ligase [Candidatus Binatia bacterium]|nr:long-chain fatty acid--CoA ligase [Candidatus Binatia bacterium]